MIWPVIIKKITAVYNRTEYSLVTKRINYLYLIAGQLSTGGIMSVVFNG